MRVLSFIPDFRIEASNVLIEINVLDYLVIAEYVLEKNEYQRKKVIKSNLQDTLKADLLKGCTIPPIVLAVKKDSIKEGFKYQEFNDEEFVKKTIDTKEILILDGLQRTYVMIELKKDIDSGKIPQENASKFLDLVIRAELYIGLQKLGILYRMLTLNTGQTTMSTRHLMEILYLDYLNTEINGINLITDKEGMNPKEDTSEFRFKEILDGYYSFIEGTEIPLERADILDNIQTIKELERTEEEKQGFGIFLTTFKTLLDKIVALSEGFEFKEEDFKSPELELSGPPFGKSALDIFKKSQCLTGFGAAMHFLKNRRDKSFDGVAKDINEIKFERYTGVEICKLINKHFDYIRNKSKKVGNDQRYYFRVLFQSLFDQEDDNYLKLDGSVEKSYKRIKEKIED